MSCPFAAVKAELKEQVEPVSQAVEDVIVAEAAPVSRGQRVVAQHRESHGNVPTTTGSSISKDWKKNERRPHRR